MKFKDAIKNINKSYMLGGREILDLLEKEGMILYKDKYDFLRIITKYFAQTDELCYLQAPLSYSTEEMATYLHLGRLGYITEYKEPMKDFEYFGLEVKKISKFWRWFLKTFKGINANK